MGLGLIDAVINSCGHDESNSHKSESQTNLEFSSTLIQRNEPFGSTERSDLLIVLKMGGGFLAAGTLLDPEPAVEFENGEEPYYDLQIGLDDKFINLSFGWVCWSFSRNEAEWLAEQLLTAAFLATKSAIAIPRDGA